MNYYKELPDGYKEAYTIDAGNKKVGIILNVLGLVIMVLLMVLLYILKFGLKKFDFELGIGESIALILLGVGFILYLVIHELTHGLFYKIFTHEKLTFGLKLSCAYCGVPQIYVKKWPMIITALAPFVIYTIACAVALIFISANIYAIVLIIFTACHIGGCAGDLFVSGLMIFKYPSDVLINDTGAKQTFYIK